MDRLDVDLVEVKFAGGDGAPRSFSGYGAVFGNLDSYGDVIAKGAFKRSLGEFKKLDRLPPMLAQHGGFLSAADLMPIGVWTKMVEDNNGLAVEGRLADTVRGNEAYTLLQDGALSGLSIGFTTKDFNLGTKPEEPRRTLKDIQLLEVSLVTFPANDLARINSVKSLDVMDEELREAGLSRSDRRKAIAIVRRMLLPNGGAADTEPREEETAAELTDVLNSMASKFRPTSARN